MSFSCMVVKVFAHISIVPNFNFTNTGGSDIKGLPTEALLNQGCCCGLNSQCGFLENKFLTCFVVLTGCFDWGKGPCEWNEWWKGGQHLLLKECQVDWCLNSASGGIMKKELLRRKELVRRVYNLRIVEVFRCWRMCLFGGIAYQSLYQFWYVELYLLRAFVPTTGWKSSSVLLLMF